MVALYIAGLAEAWGNGRRRAVLELLSAVPFGLLLEQGDIMIFGSYAYSQLFFLKIGLVPVAIALAWALIIRSCMVISDAFGVPAPLAPFTDALLAIILDLSFDAIAIRQGLWRWSIHLNQGFFGVPAGNYYAWLFVALGFSAWTRVVRRWGRAHDRLGWAQLLVPIPAYATLLLALIPFVLLKQAFFPAPGGGFPVFIVTVVIFALLGGRHLAGARPMLPRPWRMPGLARLSLHAYSFIAGVMLGVFGRVPLLLLTALVMLGIEAWLHRSPRSRARQPASQVA